MGLGGEVVREDFKKIINLFIWLCRVSAAACGIFSCGLWDLVPQPGIELGPPASGVWSPSHWTTREVPGGPV